MVSYSSLSSLRGKAVSLALLASLQLASCSDTDPQANAQAKPQAVEVGFLRLQSKPVALHSHMAGRVVAYRTAEIRPQVGGLVVERVFDPGTVVKAGDVLFRLDAEPFRAQVAAAEASLVKAQAALPSTQARAERYSNLSAQTAVSRQDQEDAQSQYLQAKADVAVAEAALETAKINLKYTEIRAPIDGIIGTTNVDAGTLLTAGQADSLATIRQLDPVYVDLTESSGDLNRHRAALETGAFRSAFGANAAALPKLTLSLPDGTSYGKEGALEARERFVSETTSSFIIRARFPNPDFRLLPGQYVRASLEIGIDDEGILVPQRAVSRNTKGEATANFLTDDDKVQQRVLSISTDVAGDWLVTGGAKKGDRIIVDGLQKVRDGVKVSPVEVTLDENGIVQRVQPTRADATQTTSTADTARNAAKKEN